MSKTNVNLTPQAGSASSFRDAAENKPAQDTSISPLYGTKPASVRDPQQQQQSGLYTEASIRQQQESGLGGITSGWPRLDI